MKALLVISVCIALLFSFTLGQQTPSSYNCNVANCQVCSYPGFCGLCNNNYMLQINSSTSAPYCQAVSCNVTYCQTCYQNNTCSICNSGYYVSTNGTCVFGTAPNTCTDGCLSCNSTACQLCDFGYNLLNGACFLNSGYYTQGCMSGFTPFTCQFCEQGSVVSTAYQCISNPGFTCNSITNCATCNQTSSSSQIQCTACSPGFQLSLNQCVSQTCNVQFCQTCSGSSCTKCYPLYSLNSTGQCALIIFQCNVANCVYCSSANVCATCVAGYIPITNTQIGNNLGSSCQQLTSSLSSTGAVPVTNCQTFGYMIPGTSGLSIGCVTCNQNFVNVGGYCVANISLGTYSCNIQNCLYCIQNNACGQCAPGFTVYFSNPTICVPNYSAIPNCVLTPIFTTACLQCASGYVLVGFEACVPLPSTPVTCNISGCNYCLTNNTCAACLTGYSPSNNTCTPICNVSGCYQCSSSFTCQICAFGLYLNNNQCLNASNQSSTYCANTFGANCTACSFYQCTQCTSGQSLNPNTGGCCPSPVYNFANCSQYTTQWGNGCQVTVTCGVCATGAMPLQMSTQTPLSCVQFLCKSITNCAYCYQSTICSVCLPGFNLNNNTCVAYDNTTCSSFPNCLSCNGTQCTACLTGYLLYNGTCVCNIQNCLVCQGSSYCTSCAFPTIATVTSSSQCLPAGFIDTICNVNNCLACASPSVCAQCFNGYTLLPNGTCNQIICDKANNCSLCNSQQTLCYSCLPGYIPNGIMNSSCSQVPANYSCNVSGCSVCQTNNTQFCQLCSPFNLPTNNGQCDPLNCSTNCILCQSNSVCTVCASGYYLNTGLTCSLYSNSQGTSCPTTAAFANCISCNQTSTNTICVQCTWGMQPASNGLSCVPQTCTVPSCQVCLQNSEFNNGVQMCLVCQQGYFLNSYFQCLPLNPSPNTPNCSSIYNCLYCSTNNYCGYCAPGWSAIGGICLTNITSICSISNCLGCITTGVCGVCAPSYQLSATSSVCIPLCNVTNCLICTNTVSCGTCQNTFVLNTTTNTCSCPDSTFNLVNNTCVCPSGTTQSNGTCVTCNVSNCQTCTATNYCGVCMNNLNLNTCACNDNTFIITNGFCVCPSGTTLSGGTCVGCNVTNCLTCSSLNVCQNCTGNLVLSSNNTCGCADQTFNLIAGICVCPSGTTLSGGTCVGCNVANCLTCSSLNVCQNCTGNLTLSANNTCGCPSTFNIIAGFCLCPSGTTLSNGTCVSCSPANCQLCSSYNLCSQCQNNLQPITCGCLDNTYVQTNGQCVCPFATTQYGGTCVACNINNCILCAVANTCQNCTGNLTLFTNNTCGCPATLNNVNGFCVCPTQTTLFNGTCIACNINNCMLCQVANVCQNCTGNLTLFTNNTCGCPATFNNVGGFCVCPTNFTLSANTCINCSIANCQSCSTANVCQNCTGNLTLSSNNTCVCPDSSFSTTTGFCLCPSGTVLQSNTCISCPTNCSNCSSANVCTACIGNLILTNNSCACNDSTFSLVGGNCVCPSGTSLVGGTCVSCSIPNCLNCSAAGVCQNCVGNLTLTANNTCGCASGLIIVSSNCVCPSGSSLVNGTCVSCNPTNCQYCSSANICQQCIGNLVFTACGCPGPFQLSLGVCVCPTGTTLFSNTCVTCNVANCQTCSSTNVCQNCTGNLTLAANNTCNCPDPSFIVSSGNCVCPTNFSLTGGTCISCNINNCLICSSANVCQTCINNLVLLSNGSCGCSSTFSLVSNTCICPAQTTLVGNVCITCNVSNCQACSAPNVCQTCQNTFNLSSNPCQCNDNTFQISNSQCVCPLNTTLSSSGSTCTPCNVTNCQLCSTANVCQTCTGNLTLSVSNNTCNCPDNTFNITNGTCVCPVGSTIYTAGIAPTCVVCNVTNCQTCSSANICQACSPTLTLATNNTCICTSNQTLVNQTVCVNCNVSFCLACSNTNFCSQCNNNFTTTPAGLCTCSPNTTFFNNLCIACNVSNCAVCQTDNICSTCATNYYGLSSTICVLCNIPNCVSCSSPNYCTSCSTGLSVNAQGSLCVSCNIANCTLCINSYTCATCSPGFQLTFGSLTCVQCTLPGCAVCSNSTTCQTCLHGYTLSNGACSLCLFPCSTCSSSPTVCSTCAFPFSSAPAQNGSCYTCTVQNCMTCSVTNTANCTQCVNNYNVTSSGSCIYAGVCDINCASCSFNQVCQSCFAGYTVSPYNNTQCLLCNVTNCITCSPTDVSTCTSCSSGYYVQGGNCLACPFSNCQTCTNTTCLTFLPSTNQMAISVNNTIVPVVCDPGCSACSTVNPTQCITCSRGFALNANLYCVPCTYPCLTCNANAPSVCLSCYGSSVLSNNTCQTCPSNCLTCSSSNVCTSCVTGQALINGACNQQCPQYCQQCSSTTVCTLCMNGYSANPQGVCLPCLFNCRICSGNAQGICLRCGIGFYLANPNTTNQVCVGCPTNCNFCNAQGCLTCAQGYSLSTNMTCVVNCASSCATCLPSNPSACTSCLYGYNLVQSSCIAANSCTNQVCTTCPLGTIPSNSSFGTCTSCTSSSNCARCNSVNVTACITCPNQYYLNPTTSTCVSCPTGCATCTSASSCTNCSSGYTLARQSVDSPGQCVACQAPCTQCMGNPLTCISCINGFSLNGWSCQSNFFFSFFVSLNTSLSTFYDNYQQFLLQLLTPMNTRNIQSVTMSSVVVGSAVLGAGLEATVSTVNVTGSISTLQQSNTNGAGLQFYGLQNSLNSGSIANMPIITSFVTANGGSVPPPASTTNLALILGICIPVGIIIIGLLVYFIFIRKSNKESYPVDYKSNNTTVRETFELTAKGQPTL